MTTEDREAGNAVVARGMGWHPMQCSDGMRSWTIWKYGEEGDPGYKVQGEPPDLYADSPEGARARELAEAWLMRRGWKISYCGVVRGSPLQFGCCFRNGKDRAEAIEAELHQATATALVAAFRELGVECNNGR